MIARYSCWGIPLRRLHRNTEQFGLLRLVRADRLQIEQKCRGVVLGLPSARVCSMGADPSGRRNSIMFRMPDSSRYSPKNGCVPFGMKLFFRWAHLTQSPAVPGPTGICGLSLFGTGMAAFAGDPRLGPLAIPLRRARLASGRLCRRPSGGRMFEAAVLHLLSADKSAGLAGHVKRRPQSPPRRDGRHSWDPAAPRQ